MDFNLTEEQTALKDTVARFVQRDYSFEARNKIMQSEAGWSPAVWAQFAELGLLAMPFPEEVGGLNGSATETMVVMEALGAAILVEPYVASVVLAGSLIRLAGNEVQKATLLGDIASGERIVAFAHTELGQRYERDGTTMRATKNGSGYTLNGRKVVVHGGDAADTLIVSAVVEGSDGPTLFIVPRATNGIVTHGYAMQDGQRGADFVFSNVAVDGAEVLGAIGGAQPTIEHALDLACAALCAEAVGAMTTLHAITVEYVKTRKQFGQAIGRFQALQHRLVDMLLQIELARSMAMLAAANADNPDAATRSKAVSAAKSLVGQAARHVGQQAVQLHGGIGVTMELNTAHYFKRLTMIDMAFGNADWHLARVSDGLLKAA